jgi:hypothetical protein
MVNLYSFGLPIKRKRSGPFKPHCMGHWLVPDCSAQPESLVAAVAKPPWAVPQEAAPKHWRFREALFGASGHHQSLALEASLPPPAATDEYAACQTPRKKPNPSRLTEAETTRMNALSRSMRTLSWTNTAFFTVF